MRPVTVTELAGMAKCEKQAALKAQGCAEPASAASIARTARGTALHRSFEAEPLSPDRRCFVASWACGPDAAETEALRRWRDRRLLSGPVGRAFVRAYYAASPALIRALDPIPGARRLSRAALKAAARFVEGGPLG